MDKLRMESPDLVQGNVEKLAALFPNCVTEGPDGHGGLKKAIDFNKLRQMLSGDVLEGDEAYEFTWVGKKAAMVEANKPTRQTLRPCPEESKNWDTTENLYIEGDNLQVLKLLQESYLGKVKMIYIDPPYNTGHDFIYNDHFEMDRDEYEQQTSMFDEEGNRNFTENTDSNPRFHSDWCSMMYSRLMLARNLLTEDGLFFCSIDDNEMRHIKCICDEVFGESQFLATFVWKRRTSSAMDKSKCSTDHEYVIAYKMPAFKMLRGTNKDYKGYSNPDNDPRGPWTTGDLTVGMTGDMRPNQYYDITDPKTGIVYKPNYNRVWSYIPEAMERLIKENRIVFPNDPNKRPMKKRFASELDSDTNPQSTWLDTVGLNTEGTKQINDLFGKGLFSYCKPLSLIKVFIDQVTSKNDIVLDFFSGSATTAHAVMQLNAEDGGHRKFIMVQLPEACDEKSESYKAGYKTICDIGKERIRRAGQKIVEEKAHLLNAVRSGKLQKGEAYAEFTTSETAKKTQQEIAETFDTGFRVFKLDDSNMRDVYFAPDDYTQDMLSMMESNIKPDRTALDLLFGCLLEWGLPLSMPYRSETIDGCTIHTYNDGDLIACFDEKIPATVIEAIARRQPLRAVFRDAGFTTSPEKINLTEIFKLLAPDTRVKVI